MKKKYKVIIDKEKCKGCMLCIGVCPVNILESTEGINKSGMKYVLVIDQEKCTGCTMCAVVCPDCAIEIEEE